jgi:hypothetical protein
MKVYAVFEKSSGTRCSKWYTRFADAKRQARHLGGDSEARECWVSFTEPNKISIPKLEDFDIVNTERKILTDGSTYVEISLKNEHDKVMHLRGGYDAN